MIGQKKITELCCRLRSSSATFVYLKQTRRSKLTTILEEMTTLRSWILYVSKVYLILKFLE